MTADRLPPEGTSPSADGRTTRFLLGVIALVAACAALKAAQIVMLPLVLSAFLTILVQPPQRFLTRYVPRWLGLTIIFMVLAATIVGIWMFFSLSAEALIEKGPVYAERLERIFDGTLSWAERYGFNLTAVELGTDELLTWTLQFAGASLASVATFFGMSTLVTFMLVMLLLETESFRSKLRSALRAGQSAEVFDTIHAVTKTFQRFFFTKTAISAFTGACTSIFCLALGIDFAFIWGMIAFLLNFIPNIGSMIAVVPPVVVALVQFDGIGTGIATLVCLSAMQMLIGNILDPRITGRAVSISPFVVFTSMVFWGWMWGIAGIFLAVPLTALLKAIAEHVPALRPLAILSGGVPKSSALAVVPIAEDPLDLDEDLELDTAPEVEP